MRRETLTMGSALSLDGKPSALVPNALLALAAAAASFAWVVPNHYEPWLSFHHELWMAAAGLLASGLIVWLRLAGRVALPWVSIAFFAAATVPVVQWSTGLVAYAGDAWLTALYLAGAGFAAWMGWVASERRGVADTGSALHAVLLVGAALSLWIAAYQWQSLDYLPLFILDITDGMRPYGNLAQPNLLATLFVLGLIGIADLHERGRIGTSVATAATASLAFGIAMTQSRAALLEVAICAVLLGALAWRRRLARLSLPKVAGALLIVLAMPLVWQLVKEASPLTAADRSVSGGVAAAGTRPLHWQALWDAVLQRPFGGYGWGSVAEAQFAVAPRHPATHETLSHAHNLLLELFVANGLLLGAAFALLIAAWLWKAARRVDDGPTALALCSVLAVVTHAMVEFPLHYVQFLVPVAAFMGCLSFATMRDAAFGVRPLVARGAWIAISIAAAVTAVDYLDYEADTQHRRFKAARIGTPVVDWPPSDRLVLTQLGAFWNFIFTPEKRGMSEPELRAMRDVVMRFPSVENMIRYAAALALNGRPADASAVLSRACKITPTEHCMHLRRLWLDMGRKDPEIAAAPWPLPAAGD